MNAFVHVCVHASVPSTYMFISWDVQASFVSEEKTDPFPSTPTSINLMKVGIFAGNQKQTQKKEFIERPGQLECASFMKTGCCNYKSACGYQHPKSRASPLSDTTKLDPSIHNLKDIQHEDFP